MNNLPNPEEVLAGIIDPAYQRGQLYRICVRAVQEYGRQVRDKTIERIAEEVDHKWLNEHILNFKNHKDLEI